MCASPWWTTRFSPRFLNVFFCGLPAALLAAGLRLAGASIVFDLSPSVSYTSSSSAIAPLRGPFRVRALVLRALAAHRQVAAVPQAAVAADLHQPLDVHRDLLAEVAFDAALLLDAPG